MASCVMSNDESLAPKARRDFSVQMRAAGFEPTTFGSGVQEVVQDPVPKSVPQFALLLRVRVAERFELRKRGV